ncbi:HNH endonuclease [bacterium]|nr:HNH endonuclease [bacterium]
MEISPVSSVSLFSSRPVENKKATNPIVVKQPETEQKTAESGALRAYFLGGNLATVSFGGFPVSTGGFITKKMNDVPCSCCGGRMVRNQELSNKAREFANLRGQDLSDKIHEDKDFFRTPQRVVMMLAAEEAEKNPSFDLARAKHEIGKNLKERTQNYCINSLQAANEVVKANYGEDCATSQILQREMEKLKKGNIGRLGLTEQLVQQQSSLSPEIYETVLDAAMNIPVDFNDVRKAHGQANGNAQSIARELLKPSMQTIEHIHPKSLGGPNATQNFVAECADCNNPRGNMSYAQWLKIHPEFPLKAQDHIEWFQQQVVDGKIDSRYDDYGVDVKETLSKESKGIIELKVLNPEKIKELREAKKLQQEANTFEENSSQNKEDNE